MGRFLFWTVIFLVTAGIILHYKIDIPYFLSWIGNLPGDMIIKKGRSVFYCPVTTAAVSSLVLTVIMYLFSRSGKK